MLALSSRTGTDREGQQWVRYDPYAKPTTTDRYLRIPAFHQYEFERQEWVELSRSQLIS
jgi:hypothetical protein